MILKALVAEDKPAQRQDIVANLNNDPHFKVVVDFDDVDLCYNYLATKPDLDVLFLDIVLFNGTAFYLLQRLKEADIRIPPVIIISGGNERDYVHEVVNIFKKEIIGFIEKPFQLSWRLTKDDCRRKIREHLEQYPPARRKPDPDQRVAVLDGRRIELISVADIAYVELHPGGAPSYPVAGVYVRTSRRAIPFLAKEKTLKLFAEHLHSGYFEEASRTAIVNCLFIKSLEARPHSANQDAILRLEEAPRLELSKRGYLRVRTVLGV